MSTTLTPVGAAPSVPQRLNEPDPAPVPGAFARALLKVQQASQAAATQSIQAIDKLEPASRPGFVRVFSGMFAQIEKDGAQVDKLIAAATNGKSVSNVELLSLQASMYRHNLQIQMLSQIVQELVSCLKQLLKMQL